MSENMSERIRNIFSNVKMSFFLASKGKEDLPIILWWWGVFSYLMTYLINKIIAFSHIRFIEVSVAILIIIYYIWHIVVIRKCTPKEDKPPVDKKDETNSHQRLKSFTRKFLLQEPITKWSSSSFLIALDLYIIAVFAAYILK